MCVAESIPTGNGSTQSYGSGLKLNRLQMRTDSYPLTVRPVGKSIFTAPAQAA